MKGVLAGREVYGRRYFAPSLSREVRTFAEARDPSDDDRGELVTLRVVFLSCVVEVTTCRGDAVFCSFELLRKIEELFIGLQVGILLCYDQEARESRREGILALLEALQCSLVHIAGVDSRRGRLATCGDDSFEGLTFVRGIALDDIHQVRDEVATSLILVFYLAPLALDILVEVHEPVVIGDPPESEEDDDDYGDDPLREFHCLRIVLSHLLGREFSLLRWRG